MDAHNRARMRQDNEEAQRELDMELDVALEQVNQVLVYNGSQSSDFDTDRQYWPASILPETPAPDYTIPTGSAGNGNTLPRPIQSGLRRYRSPPGNQFAQHQQTTHRRPLPLPDTTDLAHRADLTARSTLRELIFSALLSDTLPAPERAALLDDCRAQAEESQLGVPFREILSEPMELGVPPLLYELMSCQPDWEGVNDDESGTGMEVVLFLIEHWQENVLAQGKQGSLSWVIRSGCLRRFDEEESNKLFQQLRPAVFEKQHGFADKFVDYDITITSSNSNVRGDASRTNTEHDPSLDFCAFISIPDFEKRLAQLQYTGDSSGVPDGRSSRDAHQWKPVLTDSARTRVCIEFIASKRAWRLEIDSNALKLVLLEGPEDDPGLYVDARVRLVSPEDARTNPFSDTAYPAATSSARPLIDVEPTPIEVLLPRALLRAISASGRGTHAVSLAPCFSAGSMKYDYDAPRGFDDPRFLHDGTLLMELNVRLSHSLIVNPPAFSFEPPVESKTPIQSSSKLPIMDVVPAPVPSYPPQPTAGPSTYALVDDEPTIPDKLKVEADDDDDDGLYVDAETPSTLSPRSHDSGSDLGDGWEEVDAMDEDEKDEKDDEWVKASWSDKGEDL